MKEMIRFVTVVLVFVICCWAWGPAGDAVVPEPILPEEITEQAPASGTSGAPEPSYENRTAGTESTIIPGTDSRAVIAVLGLAAAAGAAILILRGRKPKTVNRNQQNPDTDPDKTVIIPKNGPYDCAGCTGQGKRSYQEDSLWYSGQSLPGKPVCAIVADGMGGMENGAESSAIAKEYFKLHAKNIETARDIPAKLWEMSKDINEEVFTANSAKHMNGGTTLICAYIIDNLFYWLSIGDSRIYLYRDGILAAVNEEHELENRLYDMLLDGRITLDELRSVPNRELRKLTSNIGRNTVPIIDQNYAPYRLHSGDKILLCSDGVSGSLSEEEILACLKTPDAESSCRSIADLIEEKDLPGQDNYAAVVISCRTENEK